MSDASSRRGGKLRTAVIDWLRRFFTSRDREGDADEREEYGLPPATTLTGPANTSRSPALKPLRSRRTSSTSSKLRAIPHPELA
jgi:hypothetical protein